MICVCERWTDASHNERILNWYFWVTLILLCGVLWWVGIDDLFLFLSQMMFEAKLLTHTSYAGVNVGVPIYSNNDPSNQTNINLFKF